MADESFEMETSGPSSGGDASANQQRDAFARLFASHDRWLFAYLVTLLSNPAHAEEVFQEVCVILWREYESFELGTNFVKWASVIAHNQVRKFRRQSRRRGFQLSEVALDQIAVETARRADLFDYRRDALRQCIAKLAPNDRGLIERCYGDAAMSFKSVAEEIDRPLNTVYKALNRIRRVLHECIDRTLASDGLGR